METMTVHAGGTDFRCGRAYEGETVSAGEGKEELPEENPKREKRVADPESGLAGAKESDDANSLLVLASGMSHRFNNILFAINGNVELIKMRHAEGEALNKYLDRISAAVATMANANNRLLAYAGGGYGRPRSLDLGGFVANALQQVRSCLPERVELKTSMEKGCEAIEIDESQLALIVEALVENAAESIIGRGEIRVETGRAMPEGDRAGDKAGIEPEFFLFLRVSDTGAGMDDLVKARMFEPFFTTKFLGRGLGLSAVYGILEKNGGWIDVESEIGKGSRVTAYFPAARVAALPDLE
jgi:two-component system, cell cycle sensor histidine kinase and response regulator CckA